jgi:Tfp pilus assembly protein PilF
MSAKDPASNSQKLSSSRSSINAQGVRRIAPFWFRRQGSGWQIQIYWKRFAIFTLIAGLFVWIGTATAAYFFVKYNRGFTDVRFTDMLLLPSRWHAYEVSRGDFLVSKAQAELKKQNYREAFGDLRLGLIKSPANKEGRMLLAQFYTLFWKRPDLSRTTLLDGFTYHKEDSEYLKTLFTFLLQQQDDKQVLKFYHELLDNNKAVTPLNQLVALAAASSCYFRGNYDQSESILRRYQVDSARDGRLLLARINWDRGAKDLALDQVKKLATERPDDGEIYALTITYLRDLGRDNEARRESFVRTLANPRNARARIDLLYAYQKEGEIALLSSNIEEIYRDFSNDLSALLALADFAANTGNTQLARRIYDHTKANNLNWDGAALMTVEACIVAKQYQSALELVRDLLKENPEWAKRFYAVFNGLQSIAHYGLGDAEAGQLFLNNFVKQDNVRADNLIAVSKRLLSVGAKAQARKVLEQAVQADALNQAALTSLVQLDLELKNSAPLAANVRKLLTMRKPSQAVLTAAFAELGSDLFLFSPERTGLLQDLRAALTVTLPTS